VELRAVIDERQTIPGLVRRVFSFKPGPADPEVEPGNQWFFERHYRPWLWPAVAKGFVRERRVITFTGGWIVVTVVDVERTYEDD
jgi:hypothetical protein